MSRGALAGLRVAVTRTPEQASALKESLEREGADVSSFPLIRIEPVMPAAALGAMLCQRWDWVVFTSANAVRLCATALEARHATPDVLPPYGAAGSVVRNTTLGDVLLPDGAAGSVARNTTLGDVLPPARIAVVGPATAEAARAQGLSISAMPEAFIGDEIVDAMGGGAALRGTRVLWPRAEAARDAVAQAIRGAIGDTGRDAGAILEAPVVYRSVPDEDGARQLARRILQHEVDVVTFTSPSCVRSLSEALPVLSGVKVAAIGPVTAEAARKVGYPVDIVAGEYTAEGLVRALTDALADDRAIDARPRPHHDQ